MELAKIVQYTNENLAGELLSLEKLKVFLDKTIDDINEALCAKFPAISEFNYDAFPTRYPNYNFFPDKYIRSVVITGAAYKFFVMDEEGLQTAQQYGMDYKKALFAMARDYTDLVPEEFQDTTTTGSILMPETRRTLPYSFSKW